MKSSDRHQPIYFNRHFARPCVQICTYNVTVIVICIICKKTANNLFNVV